MEINGSQLWKERFQQFLSKFLRYMRLIGNSGLIFSFVMIVIFGSYYYSLLIKQIPETFPVYLCIAVVMTYVIAKVNIRTFLKKADVVFLLACEERLRQYFSLSLIYNLAIQVAATFVVAIIFAPLYAVRADESSYSYIGVIVLFMFSKVWNVFVHWHSLKLHGRRAIVFDQFLRIFATFLFVYFALIGAKFFYLLSVAIIKLVFLGYVSNVLRNHQLNWLRLLEMEEKLLMRFLKFVHAFVDVPQLSHRVKPRRWADVFFAFLRHDQQKVPYLLYLKAFFRSGEYFGIYVRLLAIGFLVAVFMPDPFGKMIVAFLLVYMTTVQLFPLYAHFFDKEWLLLYPIKQNAFAHAFERTSAVILSIEAAAFAVGMAIRGVSLLYVAVWFCIVSIFIFVYLKRALRKTSADHVW